MFHLVASDMIVYDGLKGGVLDIENVSIVPNDLELVIAIDQLSQLAGIDTRKRIVNILLVHRHHPSDAIDLMSDRAFIRSFDVVGSHRAAYNRRCGRRCE